jgi:hypothetical protein
MMATSLQPTGIEERDLLISDRYLKALDVARRRIVTAYLSTVNDHFDPEIPGVPCVDCEPGIGVIGR